MTVFAQAPAIHWWYDMKAPSFGSAAAGDIDGDGKLEIVFGTYFNDETIHALNGEDGSVLWTFPTGGCNDASPVIADVDLDGALEVVVPASSPYHVYCLNGTTGAVEWSRSTGYPNCIDSPPAVGDVDLDGKPEVVLGTFYGYVFCLNGEDGGVEWKVNLGTNSYIQSGPNLVDLNGDGSLDIVVAQWAGDFRIYGLKGEDGSELWHSDLPDDHMYHGGSFADIDEDGLPEIAIGCYDQKLYLLNGEDGSEAWSFPSPFYIAGPTSIADLDRDGHLEIVFSSHNKIYALTNRGGLHWSFTTGGGIFRGAAISDVDGDGTLDVAFGSDDGILRVVRGDTGTLNWQHDLEGHYGRQYDIDHAPILADFDLDGKLDIFVTGGYGTSSNPQSNHGRAYLLAAGDGTGPGWPMFRHDIRHSACFDGFQPLEADLPALSESDGGTVRFTLKAGMNHAGRDYLLLGSVTGTSPGTPLPGGGTVLPLNWDPFTGLIFKLLNTPVFVDFGGTLDGTGSAGAKLCTKGPLPPGLVGLEISFAFAAWYFPWDFASNPVAITVVP